MKKAISALLAIVRTYYDSPYLLPAERVQTTPQGTAVSCVTFIIPIQLKGKYNIGNVLFLIREDAYQQLFSDEISEERNMYVISEDQIIASSSRLDVPENVVQDAAKDAGESVVPLSWEGRDYFLFLLPGDRFTVSYASLIPQETVYQQSFRFQMMFAMFLLLLGIPCAFLTVYFALRHIRPIRELSRSLGAKQHTQDDFSAIRSGIETLVGQNMDLHTRLDASLSARRAEFVRLFADTRFPSREAAVEAARGVDLAIDRAYYLTAVVSTAGGEDPGLEKMEPPAEFEGKIVLCGAEIVSEGRSLLLVFADDPETLSRWAETAYASLSAACMEPVMAVSNVHSDFSQAGTAYLEASAAYDGSPVMGGSFVLRFSDISQASEDREILLYRFAGRFYGILKSGSREEMEIWIRDLSQLLAQKKVSLSAFRLFVSDLTGVLLDKYGEGSGDLSAALRDYDIFALSRCRRVGELVDALRRLCTGFWEIRDTTPGASGEMRQVQDFLREHYADSNLTIGAVAQAFHVSSAYLSQEYKLQTGEHPSDYLISLRMEKAKELLRDTELPIKEIALQVGYYDASSFIRRFKKNTSVTPAQYRQSVQRQPGA